MGQDASQVLLRADQVAERWGTSSRFVYDLGERGVLRRILLSRKAVRFRLSDVQAFELARLADETA